MSKSNEFAVKLIAQSDSKEELVKIFRKFADDIENSGITYAFGGYDNTQYCLGFTENPSDYDFQAEAKVISDIDTKNARLVVNSAAPMPPNK